MLKATLTNSDIGRSINLAQARVPASNLKPFADMLTGLDLTGSVLKLTESGADPLVVDIEVVPDPHLPGK